MTPTRRDEKKTDWYESGLKAGMAASLAALAIGHFGSERNAKGRHLERAASVLQDVAAERGLREGVHEIDRKTGTVAVCFSAVDRPHVRGLENEFRQRLAEAGVPLNLKAFHLEAGTPGRLEPRMQAHFRQHSEFREKVVGPLLRKVQHRP